jgi:hypothetical protein
MGSVCRVKLLTPGSRSSLKDVQQSKIMPDRVAMLRFAIEETVQPVDQLIRGDRRITIDSVATVLGYSHGLAYSIMHDRSKFRKVCACWVPRELNDREKIKRTEWVCPWNTSYGMLNRIIIHECITANLNQSKGNIPVHIQPESLRLRVSHQLGSLYAYSVLGFSGSAVSPCSEAW